MLFKHLVTIEKINEIGFRLPSFSVSAVQKQGVILPQA